MCAVVGMVRYSLSNIFILCDVRSLNASERYHLSQLCVQRISDEEGVFALLECLRVDLSMKIRVLCAECISILAFATDLGCLALLSQDVLICIFTQLHDLLAPPHCQPVNQSPDISVVSSSAKAQRSIRTSLSRCLDYVSRFCVDTLIEDRFEVP